MAQGNVEVVTRDLGGDRYRMTATAHFDAAADRVWKLLSNWERLVAVGLPGMTSEFEWLSGGSDDVPSTFQFVIAGATLKEESTNVRRTREEITISFAIELWSLLWASSSMTPSWNCSA